ncbi:hypothetical protein Pla123a_47320 [Posidoniimonas polymericola]|uniref:Uncharacterized protein n=1 Tax=Posidoniimonas polymericola TaxID=2528002 RepID=A0A5C5XUE0_9BACT|nr:hypothetical protein [Posidoniimonas polymericola]TWT66338.1 hypothetical protein Pla123a_47320 [Posidoniimonas polymericola]
MADSTPTPNDPFSEANDALLDELLRQSLQGAADGQDARVERVIASLDDLPAIADAPAAAQAVRRRTMFYRLASLAAVVLIGLFVWGSAGGDAQATVLRCLEQATRFGVRCYQQTTVIQRPLVGDLERQSELYVDGANRFVIRRDAFRPGAQLWLGCDGEQCWLAPPRGPIILTDGPAMERWLERGAPDDPPLQLAGMLRRLSNHYDLQQLPDESIDTPAGEAACERIAGRVQDDAPLQLPATIELWADKHSGVARRMVLDWGLGPGDRGRSRVTIELAPTPELPDDWFEYSAHSDGRPVRRELP